MKKKFFFLLMSLLLIGMVSCRKDEPVQLASVTTGSHSVSGSVVTCNGEVTSDGGGTVTERGICYVLGSSSPSTSNSTLRSGTGVGSFSCEISGLAEGTYSYCAYAINAAGTAYGDTKMFTIAKETPKYKIVDLIGNYTCEAVDDGVTCYWTASISTYTAFDNLTWVAIKSLNYYNPNDITVGVVDENQQCVRVISGYTTNTDDVSYWSEQFSAYCYDIFYPAFVSSSGDYRLIYDGSIVESDRGEAWLTFSQNDKGQLTLTYSPSNVADQWGIKSNAYVFNIYYQSNGASTDYHYGPFNNLKMYKSGSLAAPEMVNDKNVEEVIKDLSRFSNSEMLKLTQPRQLTK